MTEPGATILLTGGAGYVGAATADALLAAGYQVVVLDDVSTGHVDTIPNAAPSGTFEIGGDLTVTRLGFGAMRITGDGVWGDPTDREGALTTLRRLPELGVNLIDTADSYGPAVSEELIREALHPYDTVVIATKGGLTRTGPGGAVRRPDHR